MNVELVVFDVAGTTVEDDDRVAHALRDALLDVEVKVGLDECARVMGLPKPTALTALAAGKVPTDAITLVVRRALMAFTERMIHHYRTSPEVRPVPGAEATFQALRDEGIKVALDTGFSRAILDAILERLGWRDGVLDATVASDEVEAGRPYPFMIQRAMMLLGVSSASNVVKVGDTVADMREGVSARAGAVVGVLTGTGKREELEHAGATWVLDSVADLPRLLFVDLTQIASAPRPRRPVGARHPPSRARRHA